MAMNNFGKPVATPMLPMEAGGPVPEVKEEGEAKEPEEMEAHPVEVKFYADISQKFAELADIIAEHGEWHKSLGEK